MLRQHLIEGEVHRTAVGVHHLLGAGTAVAVHHHRVSLGRIEIGRLHHPAVQRHAISGSEADDLALHEAIFVHRFLHVLVVVQHTQLLASLVVDGVFRKCVQVGVLQAVVVAVRTELRARPTVSSSQQLFLYLLAVIIDDVEVAI